MGLCQSSKRLSSTAALTAAPSIHAKHNKHHSRSDAFERELSDSIHGPNRTQRQKMAWHREGVAVTDVYRILQIVGQGSMGEVTVVQKKIDALDRAHTMEVEMLERSEQDVHAKLALEALHQGEEKCKIRQMECRCSSEEDETATPATEEEEEGEEEEKGDRASEAETEKGEETHVHPTQAQHPPQSKPQSQREGSHREDAPRTAPAQSHPASQPQTQSHHTSSFDSTSSAEQQSPSQPPSPPSPSPPQKRSSSRKHHRRTPRRYACKTVNTLRMNNRELREFLNEIDILRDLDHPNIVQLFEVYRLKRRLWLITELCSGGDLTVRAAKMGEDDAVVVLEQILRAVGYMHRRNVCHRDIKLENVMYSNDSPDSPIKLIDFGLSQRFAKGHKMLRACGTVYSAAPEVLLGEGATEMSDVWSIGVVAYVLLSQSYPFLKDAEEYWNDQLKQSNLIHARYGFGPTWDDRGITHKGREFVKHCLKKVPEERWDAMNALQYVQDVWIPFLEGLESTTSSALGAAVTGTLLPSVVPEEAEGEEEGEDERRSTPPAEPAPLDTSASTTAPLVTPTNSSAPSPSSGEGLEDERTVENDTGSGYLIGRDAEATATPPTQKSPSPAPQAQPHPPGSNITNNNHNRKQALSRSVASIKKRTRMNTALLQGMETFALYGELKKTILMTMAYTMDKSSLSELRDLFTVLDSKGTGTVTLLDLKSALQSMNSDKHMDDATIEKLFHGVDVDKSGQIHYNEFLAAVAESQGLITMEHLADAFDRLDSQGKGYISKDDLRNIMGHDCDEELVNRMIDEADFKKNGQVDYEEFLRLMFDDPTKGMSTMGDNTNLISTTAVDNAWMTEKLGNIDPKGSVALEELSARRITQPAENTTDQPSERPPDEPVPRKESAIETGKE